MKFRTLLCLFAICASGCHKDHRVIPEHDTGNDLQLSFDNISPKVYITVGGVKIPVIFDTGSSGLRILKGALSGADLIDLNKRLQYGYGGADHGLNVKGELVQASFEIGPLKSDRPISFMLIDKVQFVVQNTPGTWTDTGNKSALSSTGYYNGFSAIMGVGMRMDNTTVGSPLPQMSGNGKYIVHFPPAGSLTGGYVILNPSSADISKFKNWQQLDSGKYHLPNGVKSYADDSLKGTLTIDGLPYSEPTLLDTGNPAVWTESPLFSGVQTQTSTTEVIMALSTHPKTTSSSFKVRNAQQGKDLVQINFNAKKTANSFGAQFFFDYDVLFDTINGQIWVSDK